MPNQGEQAGLHIHENENFQRREWIAQRVGWVVFALILLAAALGLFGAGPLSSASVSADGVTVRYERFARRQRALDLVVNVERLAGGSLVVDFTGPYLGRAQVDRVLPAPEQETAIPGGTRFVFAAEGTDAPEVTFRLTPAGAGKRDATLLVNGTTLSFSTFVFP